jgi:serine O-acetyltransferase
MAYNFSSGPSLLETCPERSAGNHTASALSDLKADIYRLEGRFSWPLLIKNFVAKISFRPVATMRLCQAAAQSTGFFRLLLPVCQLLHRFARAGAGMDFNWRAQIGGGLSMLHSWGTVIGYGVRVGRNVTLTHGVTLGRRVRIAADGSRSDLEWPVIEDEVWIGPHAVIVGAVTVGRGSRIAAGSFVTEEVPPYSVVRGNPAVIVKRGCVPDVCNPAPLDL